jgi:hypothetical protein
MSSFLLVFLGYFIGAVGGYVIGRCTREAEINGGS